MRPRALQIVLPHHPQHAVVVDLEATPLQLRRDSMVTVRRRFQHNFLQPVAQFHLDRSGLARLGRRPKCENEGRGRMTDAKEILNSDMIRQIEETARTENRRPSEVLEDAWRRYIEERSWAKLVEDGQRNAKRLGIKECDVDRLISDYRSEHRSR